MGERRVAMSRFAIVVDFRMKPEDVDTFVTAVTENAAASAGTEPGCRRFDVLTSRDGEPVVWLYEIYDDRDAFEAHLRTEHFAKFKAATDPIVQGVTVRELTVDENAG